MPTNVTPEYKKAEDAYRDAKAIDEKVARMEDMIALLPKHKGTDHLHADLKKKLSRLRTQLEEGVKKSGRSGYSEITREGAGQIVLVGPPNCGKSTIVRELSHAHPDVGDYPFTTTKMTPGMVPYKDILIEIVDTPPVTSDYMHGQLLGLVRSADGVFLMADLISDQMLDNMDAVIRAFESRHVHFVKDRNERSKDNIPAMILANKADAVADAGTDDAGYRLDLLKETAGNDLEILPISATGPSCKDEIPELMFSWLGIVRVYTKAPGKKAEIKKPYTVFSGQTVGDVCRLVHQDFYDSLQFARLWRHGGKPMTVSKHELVQDEDVIELHL